MKKIRSISLLVCMALFLSCLFCPVGATENAVASEPLATESAEAILPTVPVQQELPFGTVCIHNGCRTINGQIALDGSMPMLETAKAVFLYETTTDTVIYSYNPDIELPPGSLSKIMSALLAVELCNLEDVVTAKSANISKLPSWAQDVNIRHDEQMTVKDLLHCMVLNGANDAAIVLAEHISGSMDGFVALMNNRAKQIGCTNTEFANVHGLDTVQQHTTARDMAKIVVEACKNETFAEIFKTPTYQVPETNKSEPRKFATQNYLMDQSIVPQFYDKRVTGGMAAYAEASGASLIVTATNITESRPNGMNLVCVILGATRQVAENGWSVTSYGNMNEMNDLVNYAFNNFKVNRVLYDGQALHQFTVAGGESNVVAQPHININTVLKSDCQMDNLLFEYKNTNLTAPIKQDEKIATVEVWYRNSCLMEAELFSMGPVKSADNTGVVIEDLESAQEASLGNILSIIGIICVVILGIVAAYLGFHYIRMQRMKAKRRRRRAGRRRSY